MKQRLPRPGSIALAAGIICVKACAAAPVALHGYVKNYSVVLDRPLSRRAAGETQGWAVANRLRLTATVKTAAAWSLHAAYELSPQFRDTALRSAAGADTGQNPTAYRVVDANAQAWPDPPGTAGSFTLLHNLDRLYLLLPFDTIDVTVGRQVLAWGSARVVNPTDIIAPYAFNVLDAEERYGVDAVRARIPLGALSELDFGWVTGRDLKFRDSAFFVRPRMHVRDTDFALLLLGFRQHLLIGVDFARPVGAAGVWCEAAYVRPGFLEHSAAAEGSDYIRVSTGLDARVLSRTYAFAEYHFNSAGASGIGGYASRARHDAYRDGAVYLLGRHYLAIGITHEITPLITLSTTALANAADGSIALAPRLEYNIRPDMYVAVGVSLGIGPGPADPPPGAPANAPVYASEFGAYTDYAFGSFRLYF